jgi:hypothetical protein
LRFTACRSGEINRISKIIHWTHDLPVLAWNLHQPSPTEPVVPSRPFLKTTTGPLAACCSPAARQPGAFRPSLSR